MFDFHEGVFLGFCLESWDVFLSGVTRSSQVFESLIHTKSGAVSEANSFVQRWVSAN